MHLRIRTFPIPNMKRIPLLATLLASLTLAGSPKAAVLKSITADQSQTGNEAAKAFDADAESKWSALGRGHWIQCELSDAVSLSQVGVGFYHGERDYAFDIRTSNDGKNWRAPQKFQSKGQERVVAYKIPNIKTRWVRLTVHGSNKNDWANIHTIHLPGISPGPTPAPGAATTDTYLVTEWASDPSIANSVAISLDDRGRAYITVAKRRKQSSLDIRHHQDLVKMDLSLTTVEERRAWYRDYLTGQSWVPDRNGDGKRDWQDLTVQKDSLMQVIDKNGDGKAETIQTLGEFHNEVTGISAGVLAVGHDVFVAAEPDFLRFVDKDGDGIPEEKQVVATGFQVHMGQGGHNLSGVTLGPDGRVYWSLADKGHFLQTKEGKTYHMPNAGGIFRCEMDGSRVERYSSGERNAQELAFDSHGNLFSMDNDGDYPGEKERSLYITEGSEHGWRLNWQWLRKQDFIKISGIDAYNPWMDEKLFLPDRKDHAAYLTPTIGNFGPGPCGFTANPGTALSLALADCFFMTNQKSEVRVFRFTEKGAYFEFKEQSAIKGGVSNTGLAIGPDGALYSASYGSKRGSIHRFDVAEENRHPAREETQKILALDATQATDEVLKRWLNNPDQRVRMKGQFELVRQKKFGVFQFTFNDPEATRVGKLHAIWGMGQLARQAPAYLAHLTQAWESGDPELIAQCAKVTGETPGNIQEIAGLQNYLLKSLAHQAPRVKFFSAIALGNHGVKSAAPSLVALLESGGSTDAYLRHAAVMGLKGAMSTGQLASLSTHQSRSVRLGAIVALRKLKSPQVKAFLKDKDELVLLEAARAIHDDQSIPDALPALSLLLERKGLTNEALIRRVINAAFRVGSLSGLQRLEAYLKHGEGSSNMKRTALASILWWSEPPVLDPVEGRYRKHSPRDDKPVQAAVTRLNPILMADNDLREVLLNGVSVRGEIKWLQGASKHFGTLNSALQIRLLEALAKTKSPDLKKFVAAALGSSDPKVQEKARQYANQAGLPLLNLLLTLLDEAKPAGQGQAVIQLATIKDPRATKKMNDLIAAYRAGKAAPAWKLELWQAAKTKGIDLPETPDRLYFGGNAERGRKLVLNHAAAQCIRCHQLGKDGSNLGPNLSKIGARRTREHLVTSMLQPTKEISEGYGTIVLKTRDGEEINGLLTRKSEDFWVVTMADGKKRNLRPHEISSHTLSSTMPPLGALMKAEEIRDVVEYLSELK